jgi:hypothetical protein
MIAHDTGRRYIDESSIRNWGRFNIILQQRKQQAIHYPVGSHLIHILPKEILVVWVVRDVKDILESEQHRKERLFRPGARKSYHHVYESEKQKYRKRFPAYVNDDTPLDDMPAIEYKVWNEVQKKRCKNYYEVEYDSLKDHPLWIDKSTRRDKFKRTNQTKV